MRIHHLPLVLLVAACTDEATSLGGPSDDVFFTCDVVVESLDPADSASELGLDATVTAFFSDVITADDILLGIEGLTGTTTVAEDGLSAIFTPDTTLEPNFSYVAEVRVCGESTTSTFDTLFLEVDPRDLEGRVFGIPFGKGTWTEPTDWDTIAFLVGIDTPDYLLLEITGSNGFDELTLNAGVTGTDVTEPEQAPCADIANWVMDFSDNPNIDTGSDSTLMFDLPWYGDFLFQNLRVTATLNPDGTALNNVVFEGILDTRALGLEGDDGPYSACDTGFINCFACDDGDLMCTDVLIEAAQGQLLDGFDLDENYDPTDDPTCQG
jgi:hypothetical protein